MGAPLPMGNEPIGAALPFLLPMHASILFCIVCHRAVFIPLLSAANEDCCNVVVGTKKDLVASQGRSAITIEDGFTLAQEVNKTHPDRPPYFETSSLTGDNVEEMFEYLFKWCEPKMAAGRPNAGISVAKDTPASGSSCSC